jgi:carbamoylphosphate synthase small subunit
MSNKAYLILEDGTKFEGRRFGALSEISGEMVFNTSMTGFQEMLSDPNHKGQIVVATFAVTGVPGANDEDMVSDCSPAGFIVREYCDEPSNFRARFTLDELMKKRAIAGLYGIDVRRLTRLIRDNGCMNAIISDNPKAVAPPLKPVDFAVEYSQQIADMKKRAESNEPIFAVEFEHLFLAAAMGGEIYKLSPGHRGSNQPVRDLRSANIYITRQNHAYAVKSIAADVGEVILENVNDKTIEGIRYKTIPAMSVQFPPSPHGGPRNTNYLSDEFAAIVEGEKCR